MNILIGFLGKKAHHQIDFVFICHDQKSHNVAKETSPMLPTGSAISGTLRFDDDDVSFVHDNMN